MNVEVKVLDISAGRPVITLNKEDAETMSVFLGDRVCVSTQNEKSVAIVDLSEEIPPGKAVIFEETRSELDIGEGDSLEITPVMNPASVDSIMKKINGKELEEDEVYSIVKDVADRRLRDSEVMAYTVATQMSEFSLEESKYLTKAMVDTGDRINIEGALDKHCIGGVPGNRTTPLIVSIIAAAGYKIPKTSSKAITSPAGTADTVGALADVKYSAEEIEDIVDSTNGCMTWGGGLDLAPADEEFIKVKGSLDLDPLEQLLSSVLSKKKSVGAETVLIDIPTGEGTKVPGKGEANNLSKYFKKLGDEMDMNVVTMVSDGSRPIGQGIGPVLEARDILRILESGGEEGPEDLRDKSIKMADILLKEVSSEKSAKEILEKGDAYEKIKEILKEQNGNIFRSEDIELAENKHVLTSDKRGRVKDISNEPVNKIAKTAGCPKDKKSGLYLHKKMGDPVEEGDKLVTIYSENESRLDKAVEVAKEKTIYSFKSLLSK